MLATFPAIVIAAVFFGKYIRKMSKERQDKLAETNTIVEETLQSFTIVKSFANEWYESLRYGKSVHEIVKISLNFAKMRGLFFIFIITILFGGIFFILWQGALLVQQGKMEVGDLFSFIIYTGVLGGAIASFGNLYTALASALGATERVREILHRKSEVDFKSYDKEEKVSIKGEVNFDHVRFTYPSRKDIKVLNDVSFDVKAGQKVALVGQSGSGKSTIVQLLMRFYDLDGGKISIDDKDIKDYNLLSLRQNIGIVPQEVILFGGTIRENIVYGKPNATADEIRLAADKSNCTEFIQKFPDGIETIIGERGIKLSGGQRQRIAIARAILKNPSILILDEATSSLDAEAERVVQEALERLMDGRTSIIIAHRLSTIKDVDCIYVLDQGEIVEQGRHEDLFAIEGGKYSYLAKLQFEV
jgi:ABC-type multidrug transport system fused ATPase/permease subunit